jgi:integrase
MPRKQKRDQDGIHERDRSPFWWASTPNGRGGSTRRSTGVRLTDDPDGKKARAIRAGWIATEPRVGTHPGRGPTFDELVLAALAERQARSCDPGRDRSAFRPLVATFTGRCLAEIGGAEVRGYIAIRQTAGVGPAAINKEIGRMSAAVEWARKHLDWDLQNPWKTRRLPEPAGRARWLSQEEAALLLAAADRRAARWPWIAAFIRLCLATGLRPGEALGLTWERVDLTRRLIQFHGEDQKSGKGGTIPMNEGARTVLLERARFRATWCPASPWVFCRRDGSQVASVKRGFAGCVAEAGLTDVHPHDLRRTFGSWLVQAGVGIERVSRLLRHADVSITAKVYAHLRPSDLADAAAVLDRAGNEVSHSGFTRPEEDVTSNKKPLVSG